MKTTPDYVAGKTRDPRNPPIRPGKVEGEAVEPTDGEPGDRAEGTE